MGNEAAPIRHTTDTSNTADDPEPTANDIRIDLESLLEIFSELEKIKMRTQAKTMASNKINMKTDFKIFCGIDFGTNGCGIAYAIKDDILRKPNDEKDDESSDSSEDSDDNLHNDTTNEGVVPDGYTIIPHKWDDIAVDNSKLNTCILLNDKNELEVMGNYARISFTEHQQKKWKLFDNFKMSLYKKDGIDDDDESEENKDDHKEGGAEPAEDDEGAKKYIALKHKIKNKYDGSITEAEIVFCATLKYLKEKAMQYIEHTIGITGIEVDDIQWILTIPALWDNASKHSMRQWGLASGLINKNITNHLKIVLEPECASLQIQYEFHNHKSIHFNKKDKYVLVDAGGGTVDIVAHEIYSDFGVKELIASFGGPYGSINIDHKINELFDILFTKKNMDRFKQMQPKKYVKLIENVVAAKRDFFLTGEQSMYHSIELNMTFYNHIQKEIKKLKKHLKSVDSIFGVSATDIGIDIHNEQKKEHMFTLSKSGNDYVWLNIHKNLWKKIFDDNCLNDIIHKIKSIMAENNISNDIKYIFMVGGLSQCKYFQKRMKDEFQSIEIVVPRNPLLSVVYGAARYGYKTDFIHTRILKKTYAVRISGRYKHLMLDHTLREIVDYMESYHDGDEKHEEHEALITQLITTCTEDENNDDFQENMNDAQARQLLCDKIKPELDEHPIPKEWIEANSKYSALANDLVCNGLLSILAKKGDQIEINSNDKITRTYKRFNKDQAISTIQIYQSDHVHPLTIDEATPLCEGQLVYPEMDENDANEEDALDVIFELSFDDSLLIAYVYPKHKPDQRAEVAMEYQTN
eukprot:139072_1